MRSSLFVEDLAIEDAAWSDDELDEAFSNRSSEESSKNGGDGWDDDDELLDDISLSDDDGQSSPVVVGADNCIAATHVTPRRESDERGENDNAWDDQFDFDDDSGTELAAAADPLSLHRHIEQSPVSFAPHSDTIETPDSHSSKNHDWMEQTETDKVDLTPLFVEEEPTVLHQQSVVSKVANNSHLHPLNHVLHLSDPAMYDGSMDVKDNTHHFDVNVNPSLYQSRVEATNNNVAGLDTATNEDENVHDHHDDNLFFEENHTKEHHTCYFSRQQEHVPLADADEAIADATNEGERRNDSGNKESLEKETDSSFPPPRGEATSNVDDFTKSYNIGQDDDNLSRCSELDHFQDTNEHDASGSSDTRSVLHEQGEGLVETETLVCNAKTDTGNSLGEIPVTETVPTANNTDPNTYSSSDPFALDEDGCMKEKIQLETTIANIDSTSSAAEEYGELAAVDVVAAVTIDEHEIEETPTVSNNEPSMLTADNDHSVYSADVLSYSSITGPTNEDGWKDDTVDSDRNANLPTPQSQEETSQRVGLFDEVAEEDNNLWDVDDENPVSEEDSSQDSNEPDPCCFSHDNDNVEVSTKHHKAPAIVEEASAKDEAGNSGGLGEMEERLYLDTTFAAADFTSPAAEEDEKRGTENTLIQQEICVLPTEFKSDDNICTTTTFSLSSTTKLEHDSGWTNSHEDSIEVNEAPEEDAHVEFPRLAQYQEEAILKDVNLVAIAEEIRQENENEEENAWNENDNETLDLENVDHFQDAKDHDSHTYDHPHTQTSSVASTAYEDTECPHFILFTEGAISEDRDTGRFTVKRGATVDGERKELVFSLKGPESGGNNDTRWSKAVEAKIEDSVSAIDSGAGRVQVGNGADANSANVWDEEDDGLNFDYTADSTVIRDTRDEFFSRDYNSPEIEHNITLNNDFAVMDNNTTPIILNEVTVFAYTNADDRTNLTPGRPSMEKQKNNESSFDDRDSLVEPPFESDERVLTADAIQEADQRASLMSSSLNASTTAIVAENDVGDIADVSVSFWGKIGSTLRSPLTMSTMAVAGDPDVGDVKDLTEDTHFDDKAESDICWSRSSQQDLGDDGAKNFSYNDADSRLAEYVDAIDDHVGCCPKVIDFNDPLAGKDAALVLSDPSTLCGSNELQTEFLSSNPRHDKLQHKESILLEEMEAGVPLTSACEEEVIIDEGSNQSDPAQNFYKARYDLTDKAPLYEEDTSLYPGCSSNTEARKASGQTHDKYRAYEGDSEEQLLDQGGLMPERLIEPDQTALDVLPVSGTILFQPVHRPLGNISNRHSPSAEQDFTIIDTANFENSISFAHDDDACETRGFQNPFSIRVLPGNDTSLVDAAIISSLAIPKGTEGVSDEDSTEGWRHDDDDDDIDGLLDDEDAAGWRHDDDGINGLLNDEGAIPNKPRVEVSTKSLNPELSAVSGSEQDVNARSEEQPNFVKEQSAFEHVDSYDLVTAEADNPPSAVQGTMSTLEGDSSCKDTCRTICRDSSERALFRSNVEEGTKKMIVNKEANDPKNSIELARDEAATASPAIGFASSRATASNDGWGATAGAFGDASSNGFNSNETFLNGFNGSPAFVTRMTPEGIPVVIDYDKLLKIEIARRLLLERHVNNCEETIKKLDQDKTETAQLLTQREQSTAMNVEVMNSEVLSVKKLNSELLNNMAKISTDRSLLQVEYDRVLSELSRLRKVALETESEKLTWKSRAEKYESETTKLRDAVEVSNLRVEDAERLGAELAALRDELDEKNRQEQKERSLLDNLKTRLKDAETRLTQQAQEALSSADESENQVRLFNFELSKLKEELSKLEMVKQQLEQSQKTLEIDLFEANSKLVDLTKERDDASLQIINLKIELDEVSQLRSAERSDYEKDLALLQVNIGTLSEERTSLLARHKKDCESLQEELALFRDERDKMTAEAILSSTIRSGLESQINQLTGENNLLAAKVKEEKKQFQQIQRLVEAEKNDERRLAMKLQQTEDFVGQLQKRLKTVQEESDDTRRQNTTFSNCCSKLTEENELLKRRLLESEAECEDRAAELDILARFRDEVQGLKIINDRLSEEQRALVARIAELESLVVRLEEINRQLDAGAREQSAIESQLRKELLAAAEESEHLDCDNEELLVQLGLTRQVQQQDRQSYESSLSTLHNKIQLQAEDVSRLERKLLQSDRTDEINSLNIENNRLRQVLSRNEQDKAALDQSVEYLSENIKLKEEEIELFIREKHQLVDETKTAAVKSSLEKQQLDELVDQKQMRNLQIRCEQLDNACTEQRSQIEKLSFALDDAKQKLATPTVAVDIDAIRMEVQRLNTECATHLNTLNEKNAIIEQLSRQNSSSVVSEQSADDVEKRHATELNSLREQLSKMTDIRVLSEQKLADYERQMQVMKKAYVEMKEEVRKKQEKVKSVEVALLEFEMNAESKNVDDLALEKLNHQITALRSELAQKDKEVIELDMHRRTSEAKLHAMEAELAVYKEEKQIFLSTQHDSSHLQEQLASQQRDILKLSKDITEKDTEIESTKIQVSMLTEKLTEKDTEIESFLSKVDSLVRNLCAYQSDFNEKTEESAKTVEGLKHDLISKEEEILSHATEAKALKLQLESMQASLAAKDMELQLISEQLEELKTNKLNVAASEATTASILYGVSSKEEAESVVCMRKQLVSLAIALERAEMKRAEAMENIVRERKLNADSLKKLGESVKRFYSALTCGDVT